MKTFGAPRHEMIGESAAMKRLRAEITAVAASEIPVLISGETGAGKELVAHQLHLQSGRRGAFVPVNACAPSDTMFEAAMFGHRRGAFTGAIADGPGYFIEADHGTLFLDEICSMASQSQAKLLRAIDTGHVRPIGGRADTVSTCRIVTASNRVLMDEVANGSFRSDLYYRIAACEIVVPPLRERREDIVPLFLHHLDALDPTGRAPRDVSTAALDHLLHHPWPGNVRELRHAAWIASVRAAGAQRIETVHLTSATVRLRPSLGATGLAHLSDSAPQDQALLESLMRNAWQTVAVARELGVSRKTVYARMKRVGLPTRHSSNAVTGANLHLLERGTTLPP
jgi:DNA-binding NtrC family response regulator